MNDRRVRCPHNRIALTHNRAACPLAVLLAVCCCLSAVSGQWLEKTLLLPDSLGGFGSPGTMLYNPGNNLLFTACENGLAVIDGLSNRLTDHAPANHFGSACYASPVNKVYWIGGLYGNTVYVLDGATGRELRHITKAYATSICYNPVVNRVYVPSYDTIPCLLVIDAASDSLVRMLCMPDELLGSAACCAPTENKVFVASTLAADVLVIDCGADSIVSGIPVGYGPRALIYNRVSSKVYCHGYSGYVDIIDAHGDSICGRVAGPGDDVPVSYNPLTNKLYCPAGRDVNIVCGYGDSLIASVQMSKTVTATVFDSTDNLVWCSLRYSDTLVAIDGQGDSVCAKVAVGSVPTAMCYNPTRNRVYLENNMVTVFDPAERQVEDRVLLDFTPAAVCWAKSSHKVYCAGRDEATVAVVSGTQNLVLGSVPVGQKPVALAYERPLGLVCCGNTGDSTVSIIACNGDSVTATVRVGFAPDLLCPDTVLHKVWCGSYDSGVAAINLQAESVGAKLGFAALDMVADPARGRVYCATGFDEHVVVIDAAADTVIASIPVGGRATDLLLIPAANLVYCALRSDDSVVVIDGATLQVISVIPVGGMPKTLVYSWRRNRLYCVNSGSPDVTVIDCGTQTPVASLDLPVRPSSVGYDSIGDRVYCFSTLTDDVAVLDCGRDSVVARIWVGDDPVAMAYAPAVRRMFVGNASGSSLSAIRDTTRAGIESPDGLPVMTAPAATVVRRVLLYEPASIAERTSKGVLLDISGRKVMDLKPGANDVRALAPGVYFVRGLRTDDGRSASDLHKVVIAK
ncbi:hypothetical protein JXD38_11040 [candidate division WOR-3 bacterium]|nr:hypothetical protein [candidate division WOR-3 bacterium]